MGVDIQDRYLEGDSLNGLPQGIGILAPIGVVGLLHCAPISSI